MCFEGEGDLITFYSGVLNFVRLFLFSFRFDLIGSLGTFCFKTMIIHFDRSSFFDIFKFPIFFLT